MLDFIPDELICPAEINPNRVFQVNRVPIQNGDIVYQMSREFRLEDNWAVVFGLELARKYNKKFRVITNLSDIQISTKQLPFFNKNLVFLKENLAANNIDFEIVKEFPVNAGALIVDFNPTVKTLKNSEGAAFSIFEVDSHNIIPARFISDKQEFSAATLRRKIYGKIAIFFTEYHNNFTIKNTEAKNQLNDFILNKLDLYLELKNNPNVDATSNMSPYLHFGFISSQRIAVDVLNSDASRENKEAYLEELIVRKELADNFCLYAPNFKTFDGLLTWAKSSLEAHKSDIRSYQYNLEAFELGKTHDRLWNAIQHCLLNPGRIHGYLRMYWAKKILEWSKSPEEALEIAIYLNDKYALDGNDPSGYVGILWSIGGIHDRPFINRMVTGKIRYMSFSGCSKKFDVKEYIASNEDLA